MNRRADWQISNTDQGIKQIIQDGVCLYKDHLKIAQYIKNTADQTYGPPHHVIVGSNFNG